MIKKVKPEDIKQTWWKETIVYQIYPRSFQDSDGDGVGDLRGIINRLDYIKDLGVETIWLSPIFGSPNDDNGYDVSDYRDIMTDFGTMADFDEMLTGMKERGLRLILDLVPNHSSDEHEWFREAKKSKDNPYRDYYFWKPAKADGSPPTNWVSYFAPSTWEWDETTQEYYLHLFSVKQPDLNWENPKVRQEIYDVMHFWMGKGIDGFRIDVLPFISKDLTWPDKTKANFDGNMGRFYANGPRLHEFIKEMNREVISKYDMMTVGEGPGISPEQAYDYVGADRDELHTIYHFDHMDIDRDPYHYYKPKPYSVVEFKKIVADWDRLTHLGGWNTAFLGNHDFPRIVSRFGDDGKYRKQSAKLLCLFLMTQRGTPYVYFGEEIGMTNVPWTSLDKYRDLWVFDGHQKHLAAGGNEKEFLENLPHTSRDNARTPMQWNRSDHSGFTKGKPWIDLNPRYTEINVEEAQADPESILHFYKKMLQFRRGNKTLVYGDYQDLLPNHPKLYVYTRIMGTERFLIVLNMSDTNHQLKMESGGQIKEWVMCNYDTCPCGANEWIPLRPWEACLLRLD